jgi:hypothetical protein
MLPPACASPKAATSLGGQRFGVGPMGNPLPSGIFDPNADSYGRYGARAGIAHHVGQQDLDADLSDTDAFISRR